ncbi:ribosomal protein S2 [Sphaerochaeta pleomorpha str. Grapes]|uniref:Small ribosomal subunit protein uS2 n=1 Tax=Sphaerochaeta pleomorpha (strain ATCC BAA-1885 / DSM 22778 / Grapes) TaxID=158190 RepID=G8QXY0_SPHPG|nr:30S ribosomal protein S2 [Sphaerochaeta pleomorpha]AEV28485.1 ribosomal protein S2 [Sphaerochaeta pleomorpha str. Grapes]
MSVVTMKSLLESGVHFGHQTKRWNPKMARFIFSQRNGIHIIDLQKTSACIVEAYDAVRAVVKQGKSVLFVGTKKQAQQAIENEAKRCGMPYVNNRWLGGMLTNFSTIKKSVATLKKIEKMEIDGTFESLTKKEVSLLTKQKTKLEKNLGGIKDMKDLPGALFIIDTKKEAIAVEEAKRLGIPVIAVVDTNCDPTDITYPIPGNDDAIRAISLFVEIIANAVVDADNEAGIQIIETLGNEEETAEEAAAPAVVEEAEEAIVFSTDESADFSKFEETKEEAATPEEVVTEKKGIVVDEETLYKD